MLQLSAKVMAGEESVNAALLRVPLMTLALPYVQHPLSMRQRRWRWCHWKTLNQHLSSLMRNEVVLMGLGLMLPFVVLLAFALVPDEPTAQLTAQAALSQQCLVASKSLETP